jgi:CheY-like chemotaxis protein
VYIAFGVTVLVGAAVAVLSSAFSGGKAADGLRLALYMLASSAVAVILGLIFGVPRARAEFVAGASERYASNSNLEQISDWLTKLLVGAGLVELGNVPGLASRLGAYLGAGISTPNASALSIASTVYGAGVGFITGYLWTRLRLRLFLEASDRLAAEVSKVQGIADNLRRQNEAHAKTERGSDISRAAESAVRAREAVGGGSIAPILWVDDVPQNNSAIVASLRSLDIEVDEVRSTAEALEALNRRSYGLIISDLGRQESDGYNPTAGVDLITAVRAIDISVPIFIFGTHRAVAMQRGLLDAGATLVTTRASVLFEEATKAVTVPTR